MGVIFGIINFIVIIWFFSSAVSVKKQALLWALIGGLSFLAFKVMGYSIISLLQGAMDQASLDVLAERGYVPSEKSAETLSNETFDDQYTIVGIFYEFFPLIVALLGVSFIRAKYILEMGYIASLKHKTSLKLVNKGAQNIDTDEEQALLKRLSDFFSKLLHRKNS